MQLVTNKIVEEEGKLLKLVAYGEPGSGKTHFGCSGALDPLTAPVLFLEYRAQIGSIRCNPAFTKAIDEGNLIILRLEKYSELSYFHTWLTRGRGSLDQLDNLMTELGHGPEVMPKTVVIDSLTEIHLDEVKRIAGNSLTKFLTEIEQPEIQHWNTILSKFTTLAHWWLQRLPYNMVFLGLEAVDFGKAPIGEVPPIVNRRIALQGSSQRQFPAYAYTVMHLEQAPRGSGIFNIGRTRSVKSKTKEQTGLLPSEIPNPTIPMLVKLLQGGEVVKSSK